MQFSSRSSVKKTDTFPGVLTRGGRASTPWQPVGLRERRLRIDRSGPSLASPTFKLASGYLQKDRPLFPGADQREFWQRSEARNRTTAKLYDELGLPEYEAIEAFVRWKF